MHSSRKKIAAIALAAGLTGTAVVSVANVAPPPTAEASTYSTHPAHAGQSNVRSAKAVRFRNAMRKLWGDHIVWTRQFIVSAVAGLPDTDTAAERLLKNQVHIGNAIKPYYGNKAGNQLASLLTDHILIAADLVGAAKNGDEKGVAEKSEEWDVNGRQIADFLSSANPDEWSRSEMRSMMAAHLEWTLNEAVARLNADWDADVEAYDHIHRDILHMADMLSAGIIAQFPGKF